MERLARALIPTITDNTTQQHQWTSIYPKPNGTLSSKAAALSSRFSLRKLTGLLPYTSSKPPSSSLSRAGKKVLQLDPNPYYGSAEAAFSLDELETWISTLPAQPTPSSPFSGGTFEKRGDTKRSRDYTLTLAPHILHWDSSILELLRDVQMTTQLTWLALGSWWIYLTDEALAERPETGSGIEGAMIDAGVKAIRGAGTLRKKAGWNKNRKPALEDTFTPDNSTPTDPSTPLTPSTNAAVPAALRSIGSLREVPCTIEDVAFSPTLADRDRGYLGGFLRFLSKAADPAETTHHALLQENLTTPFSTFISTNYPLPPSTIASLHSLTLLPTPPHETPLATALPRLTAHLSSLGRIADARSAAALTVAYGGSAEICQVLSRAAAVSGALNVLNRSIATHTTTETGITATLTTGETVTAAHLIIAAAPTHTLQHQRGIFLTSAPFTSLLARKNDSDNVAPATVIITFPVAAIANSHPVYCQIRAAATFEAPHGHSVVYTETLDSSAGVAEAAVRRLLEGQEHGEVLIMSQYTQDGGGGVPSYESSGRVVRVPECAAGVLWDEGVVSECKEVWRRVVGEEWEGRFCERVRREGEMEQEVEDL